MSNIEHFWDPATRKLTLILQVCVGLGQTDEEGKKFAKFDEIVKKVGEAKNAPNSSGNYHDYVELLRKDTNKRNDNLPPTQSLLGTKECLANYKKKYFYQQKILYYLAYHVLPPPLILLLSFFFT